MVTMDIGAFKAKEIVLQCPNDQAIFCSSQLRSLAPHMGTYGFDVMEYIGKELFVHCHNEKEIKKALGSRNIFVSQREIGYLGKKFIVYLALAHAESRGKLVQSMKKRGGYILHVDGTCEGDSPHLFCGMDGISELVLDNIKIPSEKKELLIPFFQRIRNHYGDPVALVHDMGIGILRAIEQVFPGIPDFICHFHFLRDVGKDLLLDDYQTIIQRLRKHKVRALLRQKARYLEKKIEQDSEQIVDFEGSLEGSGFNTSLLERIPTLSAYTLIHWIFESPRLSRGYGFPFDRPHLEFYRRLKTVHDLLQSISGIHLRDKAKDNRPFIQVNQLIEKVLIDGDLNNAAAAMEEKIEVFDKLREALRIAMPEGKNGLNDNGDEMDIKTIEEKVATFKEWLIGDESRNLTYLKMIEQMNKYWKKLFADPLIVNTPEGPVTIAPQRTNNILERFFRGEKRRGRKRSGTASLNKTLKTILADTPLVRNLEKEEYQQIILNGCSSLAERFSQIDDKIARDQLKQAEKNREKILPEVKKIIKRTDLPQKISALFFGHSKFNANCHLPT
ncbi:MAG: transposase [Thermodesulfobacteriota bacterium]|nr:transposase [Thermodesulfobacteriota bacterium]